MTLFRRSAEIEASAEQMRQARRRTAQALQQARADAQQGDEAARRVLETYTNNLRQGAGEVPNPDRRVACERYAAQAWAAYHNYCAVLDLNREQTGAVLAQLEEAAHLYGLLAETAPF